MWLPISVQNVSLWIYQIPSFLLLLLNHPELGSHVRKLTFLPRHFKQYKLETSEMESATREITSLNHPNLKISPKYSPDVPSSFSPRHTMEHVRSIILSHCTRLKELTFPSTQDFLTRLPENLNLIFSERLTSITTIDVNLYESDDLRNRWNGKHILLLLIALPELKSASFEIHFTYQDSRIFNEDISVLMKANKRLRLEKLKNFALWVHPMFNNKKKYWMFNWDLPFKAFLSIFYELENLTLKFFQDPLIDNDVWPAQDKVERRDQHPTLDILNSLQTSFKTLQSLSISGLTSLNQINLTQKRIDQDYLFQSRTVSQFTRLKNLRSDVALISIYPLISYKGPGGSIGSEKCQMPPNIQVLELGFNCEMVYNFTRGQSHFRPQEHLLTVCLEQCPLPRTLKIIRTNRSPVFVKHEERLPDQFDENAFYSVRSHLVDVVRRKGLRLELV